MEIATDLDAPWSVLPLENGSTLISERDSGRILELTPGGDVRTVETIDEVGAEGEAGLHGLAISPTQNDTSQDGTEPMTLFAFYATDRDNRLISAELTGEPGSLTLGEPEVILSGIERNWYHGGGRIAFGPDGYLYVSTGDAGTPSLAQNRDSLAGKILRITTDGEAAPGNPFDNEVYSYGHRNVQGLAWDSDGNLYASEFGQDTWDELNLIQAGANYGWPMVEGEGGDDRYVDPVAQWPTDSASPSGLTRVGDTLFMAALRGERIWTYALDTADPNETLGEDAVDVQDWLVGDYGRIRDVVPGPDNTLWFLTNNTDGRGDPAADDDKLLQIGLVQAD